MFTFIMTLVGAFFGAVFGVAGVILYDRFKRPTPNYDFEFEKEVSFQTTVGTSLGMVMPATGCFPNYIRIKNYSAASLFNISTKICFNTKRERRYYQTMEIAENLFDWEAEQLSAYSDIQVQHELLLSIRGEEEVFEERIKHGFFVPDEAMEKLKRLTPIKVKVEYEWDENSYSDIWLFDFSDENEVRFYLLRLTFLQKQNFFLKGYSEFINTKKPLTARVDGFCIYWHRECLGIQVGSGRY